MSGRKPFVFTSATGSPLRGRNQKFFVPVGSVPAFRCARSCWKANSPSPVQIASTSAVIASWGSMIERGFRYTASAPWLTVFPGLLIALTVLAFNLLGDGLRDSLGREIRRGA